jgi:ParB-like chromosome segregation protein Spo0J
MHFRDRIRELRRVPANELLPNPRNWRLHPPEQQAALAALLAEVGFAGALLARERDDGRLELIDGHLRAAAAPNEIVPVLVLDVDEIEAAKLLATFDRLSAAAQADYEQLRGLLATIDFHSSAIDALFEELRQQMHEHAAHAATDEPAPAEIHPVYQVLVDCRDEAEQREVYEAIHGAGHKCRLVGCA